MIDQDKERAEFEASYKSKHSMAITIRLASGRYYSTLVESAWQGWQASAERSANRIAELESQVAANRRILSDHVNLYESSKARIECLEYELKLRIADTERIDWLADKNQTIGNVMLPEKCIYANLSSLRDAIDEAMKGGV